MAYEVMTGMINLDELEVKSNAVAEISAGTAATVQWCQCSRGCGSGTRTVIICHIGNMFH